ncbi:hypothetical protein GCM10011581_21050 [Saccharopolyspora subtropica]|uniref:PAS domain S-box-containing protein/diguanylate cyclase (GGDEF)-like protein n=2 Tax=Saccharopolyspora thermophila TaxID=89367 RepID=A0A917JS87_9PSEU|nr:hypothetical protein GCM10011581_21050 [Saccharopolyspora subtropica]
MTLLDQHERFIFVNDAFCDLLGYDRDELLRRHQTDLIHPDDVRAPSLFDEVLADPSGEAAHAFRVVRCDGEIIWLLLSASVIRDDCGRALCVATVAHNITDRRETALRWQRTFAHAPIGMALLDTRGYWTEVNAAFCKLLGYERAELLRTPPTRLTYPGAPGDSALTDVLDGRVDSASFRSCLRHKAGYPVWLFVRVSGVLGADGRPAHLVGQYEELGARRMSDTHLAHLALHDPLTGLANRVLLGDRLDQHLAELPRLGGVLTVLLVDLDELKRVNDLHGHAVGDRMLMAAGDALLRSASPGDTVARLGGDEFAVLSRLADLRAARAFRDRVERFLRTDVLVSGKRLPMRASVGLATTADATTRPADLLHAADQDMYTRKRRCV